MNKFFIALLTCLYPIVTFGGMITSYQALSNPSDNAYSFFYDPNQTPGHRDRVVTIGTLKTTIGGSWVPATRKINGYALSTDFNLVPSDLGAVPITRAINGHTLGGDFSISLTDLGIPNVTNTAQLPLSYFDADHNMTANSDTRVPSQGAVVAYVAANSVAPAWGSITGTLSNQLDLQTALNTKAPTSRLVNGHSLASDFSISLTDLGIPNVTNTAQMPLSYLSTDGTMVANSNTLVPSQAAIRTYVAANLTNPSWGSIGGTLTNQTDLVTALGLKLSTSNLPSSSTDSQVALFSGTTGKVLTYATGTGFAYITSGVLSATTNGSTLTTLNGSNISSGTVAAARGGAGAVTGVLYANGSGTVSAATAGQMNTAIGFTPMNSTAFSGTSKITVGTTQPISPSAGDLWVDTTGL